MHMSNQCPPDFGLRPARLRLAIAHLRFAGHDAQHRCAQLTAGAGHAWVSEAFGLGLRLTQARRAPAPLGFVFTALALRLCWWARGLCRRIRLRLMPVQLRLYLLRTRGDFGLRPARLRLAFGPEVPVLP